MLSILFFMDFGFYLEAKVFSMDKSFRSIFYASFLTYCSIVILFFCRVFFGEVCAITHEDGVCPFKRMLPTNTGIFDLCFFSFLDFVFYFFIIDW